MEWQTDEDSDEGVKENILSFSRGVFYLCHESPKLKSNCAFIKLREIKKQYSRTGGGEFIQKGECGGTQVPATKVGLTQNAHEELVSCPTQT